MNPMFMTNMSSSSMEEIIMNNNEATAAECNPSISLPLLIGLSRSTYAGNGGNDSKNNKNGDNAANDSTDTANSIKDDEQQSSNNKDDNTDDDQLIKIDPKSSFPQTLHTLLSTPKYSSTLSWMVHGRSFKINDTTVFVTQILSQYFNTSDQGDEGESGDVVAAEGDGNKKQGAVTNATENANNNNNNSNSIDDLQSFENELYKWGFKLYKGTTSTTSPSTTSSSKKSNNNKKKKRAKKSKGVSSSSNNKMKMLDVGSYYQQDFLRGQFDLLDNMVYNNNNEKKEKSEGKGNDGDDKEDEDEVKDEDGDIKMCDNSPPPPPPSSSPEEDESLAESSSSDDDIAPPPPPPPPPQQQHSEEVQAFLTFTNTSDPRIAIQYLEMTSNNNLEMAVSLFMDHGQPSAVALGLPPLGGGGGSSGGGGSGGAASGGASSARSGGATSSKAAKNKKKGKEKEQQEEEEEEEEEPDFYSLPFLPPLSLPLIEKKKKKERKILPAEKIVECALREYCAFRIIRRALLHWILARRRTRVDDGRHAAVEASSQLGSVLAKKNHHHAQQLQKDYGGGGTSHFLFQSLRHSSLPVRRAAARMILHNLHHIQQRHTTSTTSDAKEDEKSGGGDKKKSINDGLKSSSSQGLQEALVILLHSLMFGETPYQHQSSQQRQGRTMMMIPRTKNQAEGGDPALQIMGLLVSLVCDGGFSNILVGDEVKDMIQLNPTLGVVAGLGVSTAGYAMTTTTTDNDDEDNDNILAKSILSEMSSDSIESFVAAGGLRWACGSIVRLVHMLIHGTGGNNNAATAGMMMMGGHNGGSDNDGNNSNHNNNVQVDPMEDITSRTIQTRLLLLIDLVYRLVLFGSVPAAVDKHSSLSVTTIHDGGSGGDGGSGDGKNSSKKSSKSSSGDEAGKDSSSRTSSRRLKSRELYEMLSRETAASSGETSRTSSHTLRQSLAAQSLRASIGNPPLTGASERASSRLKRGSRSAGGGGSLANLPSGGGGDDDPSSSMADENRRSKDRRRATLERVHKLFWSSTLPAAVCLPPMSDLTSPTIINATHEESPTALGELTPLACLIAAYEILRSHPKSESTLSTNSQLRTLEKGIAILGRIVDPGAGNAVVTVDGDLPWGLAGILGDNAKAFEHGIKEKKSRKRDRSSSHDRSRSSSASRASRLASGESPTRNTMGRAKRSRTSGSVASLLERLTNAEAASTGASGGATSSSMSAAQSAMDSALAASSLQAAGAIRSGGGSSLAADRYRSVMESMMLRGTGGGASSSSAAAGAAARADRDGSINRILASVAARADASPAPSQRDRDASLSRLLASGSTTASPGRAGGEPAPEEWRVLHALPEGMDVEDDMEIIDNEGGESGDMDETNDNNNGDGDNSDEDDSEADSAAMDDEIVDIDGNNPRESNNNNDDEDSDDDGYNEDNDEEVYDTSQFDDAVINLEEIETLTSSNAQPDAHHSNEGTGQSQKNPHRHSSTTRSPAVSRSNSSGTSGLSPVELALKKREREQAFLCAAMSLLAAQYPQLLGIKNGHGARQEMMITQVASKSNRFSIFSSPAANITPPLLTINAEQSLLQSLCNIVKPPRKKLNLKIFLRRAPTQEEFFRGNLSKNPIGLSSLKAAGASSSSGGDDRRSSGGNSGNDEPLVSDLRLHIAKDLQMEDSAELLELLVANKILDMNLKLRVVQQVLWKKYVEENATSASSAGVAGAGPSHQMISTGNGLSMIFSNSGLLAARNRGSGAAGSNVADDNAILASFPPMVVTYRLAGVDGEATEDNVEVADIEDPEAPSSANSTPAAIERRMEKEFGITRMITQHHGVAVLLASVQGTISDLLRRIRRDEVARRRMLRNIAGAEDPSATANNEDGNTTREQLAKSPPCPGLKLLRLCANIPDNRKKMLANRAPTLLLRILLDILNAMNRSSDDGNRKGRRKRSSTIDFSSHSSMDVDLSDVPTAPSSTRNRVHHVEGNPTTEALQEIIEMLASDISAEISDETSSSKKAKKKSLKSPGSFVNLSSQADADEAAVGGQQSEEDRTLPLVLKSLHSTELSPPLRKVIAKLLPFLTYGQVESSRELASYFCKYVNVSRLGTLNTEASSEYAGNALMNTFVDTAINLPPVSVCDNLRTELIYNGFVNSLRAFLLEDAPRLPPPWSPALFSKSSKKLSDKKSSELKEEWRNYFDRPGLSSAFKILTGLSSCHDATQLLLSDIPDYEGGVGSKENNEDDLNLLTLCHWMESTSDNTASDIKNPNGILAETFLDALKEDNEVTSEKINAIRKKLRDRKRELAEERRNKALVGMSAFGTLTGSAVSSSTAAQGGNAESAESRSMFGGLFSSLLAAPSAAASSSTRTTRASSAKADAASQPKAKPSWMDEMEAMADEAGATCAVCQEGRTLQPSELLGMYAYMKKVTISSSQGGGKGDVDGTAMLLSLPTSFPHALMSSTEMESLFTTARRAANALEGSSHAISAMSASSQSRSNYYITTVSAGNAIHCTCHKKARTADRNHPKAPKSEWEGASLRNSRVTCNVILPLVSSKTTEVSLMAVETALAEYNTIVTNTLGARPKSILWNSLNDVRFLLLRMAHGESLGADCGGGSSSSNFLLLLYELYSADMFAQDAEHDESLEVSRHARGLSAGYLVGVDIVDDVSFERIDNRSRKLERGVADSAPMSALLSILFYNMDDKPASGKKTHDISGSSESKQTPSPTRQWQTHKSKFLAGIIRCAGRRHSLGLTDSGCVTSRGISTGKKNVEKARSFLDWTSDEARASKSSHRNTMIEEYSEALRPMITLYAIFDQLSKEFVVNNDDESTEESSERLAAKLESCYKADSIQELLRIADINVGNDVVCKYFEKGATS